MHRSPRTAGLSNNRGAARFANRGAARFAICAFAGLCAALATLCAPTPARAYDERIHVFISRRALRQSGLDAQKAAPYGGVTSAAVRRAIDDHARNHPDAALRAEWLRRYPTPAAFDTFAEKELLLLNPTLPLYGFDKTDERVTDDRLDRKVETLLDLVVRGSREPDDDMRNRERVAQSPQRTPLKDAHGQLLPADPALLNLGKLGALSSQAHAHYGLPDLQFSSDPEVLKTDPRRFAVASSYPKGPILSLAAEMAQEHLDLALLASLAAPPDGAASGLSLTYLHTGQAFHYLEDVSNQIHTVQVGLYDFFVDAFKARLLMSVRTCGGYCGHLRSLSSIGIDILTNHHTLSEALVRKRVVDAVAEGFAGGPTVDGSGVLMTAPERDDPAFVQRMDQTLAPLGAHPERGEFALAITRLMIDVSSYEGDKIYRATRLIAAPRLRQEGVILDDQGDPEKALDPLSPKNKDAYRSLFYLQRDAFSRAGTALRRIIALEKAALATQGPDRDALRAQVLDRLVRRQLRMLGEAEARRADYLKDPPSQVTTPERMPAVLAVEIAVPLLILALVAFLVLRRKRSA